MVKIMKNQKVVIVLAGRYAGRKAVIVKVILSSIEFNSNLKFLAT
jgi:ribosomal protein L14E/L6E/L27E